MPRQKCRTTSWDVGSTAPRPQPCPSGLLQAHILLPRWRTPTPMSTDLFKTTVMTSTTSLDPRKDHSSRHTTTIMGCRIRCSEAPAMPRRALDIPDCACDHQHALILPGHPHVIDTYYQNIVKAIPPLHAACHTKRKQEIEEAKRPTGASQQRARRAWQASKAFAPPTWSAACRGLPRTTLMVRCNRSWGAHEGCPDLPPWGRAPAGGESWGFRGPLPSGLGRHGQVTRQAAQVTV